MACNSTSSGSLGSLAKNSRTATTPDPGVWAFPAAPPPETTPTTTPATTEAPTTTTSAVEATTTTTEAIADDTTRDDELAAGDDDRSGGAGDGSNPAAVAGAISVVGVLAGVTGWLLWSRRTGAHPE